MGAIFTKKKPATKTAAPARPEAVITDRDRAVYDLKVQRDRLRKFIAKNDAVVAREISIAKELLSQGRKDRALLVLRKKRLLESSIEKALAKMANVEELVNSIQFAEMTVQVFAALKEGSETLQQINAQMDVEEVAKLMEDSAEAIAYQDQISELLGSQLTTDDDAAAEVELERIEMEEAAKLEFPELPARPVEIVAERQVQEPRPEQVLVE